MCGTTTQNFDIDMRILPYFHCDIQSLSPTFTHHHVGTEWPLSAGGAEMANYQAILIAVPGNIVERRDCTAPHKS